LFDETIVISISLLCLGRGHGAHPVIRPRCGHLTRRSLLRYSIARVDPVSIDVDGGGEVVDVGLECLAADFALEVADAGLLLDGDGNGFLVVAEEALESGGQLLLLGSTSVELLRMLTLYVKLDLTLLGP
jgi:hypothetical protein